MTKVSLKCSLLLLSVCALIYVVNRYLNMIKASSVETEGLTVS